MRFKIVGNFRTALTRQITEAVRIRNRGKSVLNSKGGYNRCRIHRLTIGTGEMTDGGIMATETEGTTKEDVVGEHYLLEKRKELDRGRMKYKEDMGSTNKKRGNNEDVPMVGRPSKRRKFVLIGSGWGENVDKGETGLDVERETGPFDRSNVAYDLITLSSEGNMIEEDTDQTVGTSIAGEQDTQIVNLDQRSEGGTGPLVGTSNNEEDDSLNMRGNNNQNKKKTQLSITKFTTRIVERGDTTALKEEGGDTENVGNLYDTANNVRLLREMRGDCVIRDGYCQEHNLKARKFTTVRNVWTKSNKTGVFGYRRRKVSTLRCNGHMGNLVGTMRTRDGSGENNGAF